MRLSNVIFGGDKRQLKTRLRSEGRTLPADYLIFSLNGKILYRGKPFQFMYLYNENLIASSIFLLLQIFLKKMQLKFTTALIITNAMLRCCKIRIHCRVTWFCPKQSCSRNRPFILSTWFAHAHRYVVSSPNFAHKNLHFINATLVEKYWWRHLAVWIPLDMRQVY